MKAIVQHTQFSRRVKLMLVAFVWAFLFCHSATSQELAPQQKRWFKYYSKQQNAPKLDEMLLNSDAEPELSEGFNDLFNGVDLKGWESKGGGCTFAVKDKCIEAICVLGSASTYLCTKKSDYQDFVFTCDMKWEVDGNSGVQFRSKSKPGKDGEIVFGPQFEMEGLGKEERHWSGGIYGQSCGGYFYPLWLKEHQAARAAQKVKEWNRITISAEGNVVKTWLNGVPASHWVDDGTYSAGFFALQSHKGKAGTVLFKNLRVKNLAQSEAD